MALQQTVRQNNKFTPRPLLLWLRQLWLDLRKLELCQSLYKVLFLLWTHLSFVPKCKVKAKTTAMMAVTGFSNSKATFISIHTFNGNNDKSVSWQISPLHPLRKNTSISYS